MLNQKLHECFQTHSKITNITVLSDELIALSTKLHGIKIFSLSDCAIQEDFSINLLGEKTTATAFSKEHKLFAFANSQTIHIINLQNRTTLQTIYTDEGEIEVLTFVENSAYLITGTKEGYVSQYRYDTKTQLSCLCSFPNLLTKSTLHVKNSYVSAITSNETYIASSGYGGDITLIQINSLAEKIRLQTSKVRINVLLFVESKTLISGNADGIVQIHSLQKEPTFKNITTPFTSIKNIILMPNKRFIMVSADSKKLILIDIDLAKIVSYNYLVFEHKVEKLLLTKKSELLVALKNQELLKIKLTKPEEINAYILHNSLDKAFALVENDPMLQGTQEHQRLEAVYQKIFSQAITALTNANKKEALRVTEIFQNIKSKKEEIYALFKAYENYPRFKTLSTQKNYALLYAMAHKYPALKQTREFKKAENSFKKAFRVAQKELLRGEKIRAREVLSPYITIISKKIIIRLLLNDNSDFIRFLKALQEREYLLVKELVTKDKTLKQIPAFTNFQDSIADSLKSVQKSINESEIDQAIVQIKSLQNIPTIQKELKDLYTTCKGVEALQKSYKKNDFKHCYEILDTNNNLEELQLTKLLEKHWTQSIRKCEEFALCGNIKGIKEELGELIHVQTRAKKTGDLLRVSFHTKIESLLKSRSYVNAENLIYSYIDIFGIDKKLKSLMKNQEQLSNKKLAITLNQEKVISRDAWLYSSLIMQS